MLPILETLQLVNSSLPFIPPGAFFTTWYNIKVYGAICFALGWLAKILVDFILFRINENKNGKGKEVTDCQED